MRRTERSRARHGCAIIELLSFSNGRSLFRKVAEHPNVAPCPPDALLRWKQLHSIEGRHNSLVLQVQAPGDKNTAAARNLELLNSWCSPL